MDIALSEYKVLKSEFTYEQISEKEPEFYEIKADPWNPEYFL